MAGAYARPVKAVPPTVNPVVAKNSVSFQAPSEVMMPALRPEWRHAPMFSPADICPPLGGMDSANSPFTADEPPVITPYMEEEVR